MLKLIVLTDFKTVTITCKHWYSHDNLLQPNITVQIVINPARVLEVNVNLKHMLCYQKTHNIKTVKPTEGEVVTDLLSPSHKFTSGGGHDPSLDTTSRDLSTSFRRAW